MKKKMNPEGLAKEAAFWTKMKAVAKEGPKKSCRK
jgi:chitodextrinase